MAREIVKNKLCLFVNVTIGYALQSQTVWLIGILVLPGPDRSSDQAFIGDPNQSTRDQRQQK